MDPIIQTIEKGIRESRNESPINKEIYTDKKVIGKNEFLFFLKPEITLEDEYINLIDILRLIFKKIESFSIKVKNIRIVNATYLAKHNIIAKHYGVINMLSRNIQSYVSEEAKSNFEKIFGISFENSEVYGSLEFLEKFPHFTPTGLSFLWQNIATEKIAGGTYTQKLTLDGQTVFIVNGFHPRQLEHFIAKDRCIVTMTLVTDISWKEARNNFIGKTNPNDALPGSIRHELLINKEKLGLHNVSSSWNGVHLSAGPVEGLVELMRYNSDYEHSLVQSAQDYTFGLKLAEEFENTAAEKLLKNPVVQFDNKQVSIFDLTEETDSDECLEILKKINLK